MIGIHAGRVERKRATGHGRSDLDITENIEKDQPRNTGHQREGKQVATVPGRASRVLEHGWSEPSQGALPSLVLPGDKTTRSPSRLI